jgi:hypothetical protein
MAHAYIAAGEGPCRVLSLCSAPETQVIAANATPAEVKRPQKAPSSGRKSRRG